MTCRALATVHFSHQQGWGTTESVPAPRACGALRPGPPPWRLLLLSSPDRYIGTADCRSTGRVGPRGRCPPPTPICCPTIRNASLLSDPGFAICTSAATRIRSQTGPVCQRRLNRDSEFRARPRGSSYLRDSEGGGSARWRIPPRLMMTRAGRRESSTRSAEGFRYWRWQCPVNTLASFTRGTRRIVSRRVQSLPLLNTRHVWSDN